jgi:hypothetical protein
MVSVLRFLEFVWVLTGFPGFKKQSETGIHHGFEVIKMVRFFSIFLFSPFWSSSCANAAVGIWCRQSNGENEEEKWDGQECGHCEQKCKPTRFGQLPELAIWSGANGQSQEGKSEHCQMDEKSQQKGPSAAISILGGGETAIASQTEMAKHAPEHSANTGPSPARCLLLRR